MSDANPQFWINMAVEQAGRLRAAGVRRLRLGDFEIELDGVPSPATAEQVKALEEYVEQHPARAMRGPLDDPATFGRQDPNAKPPGYGEREYTPDDDED